MRLALAAAAMLAALLGIARADVDALQGHGGPVMALASAGEGAMLSASFDNSVGLWDLASGEPRWLEGHLAAVKDVIALPGEKAASAGDDFSVIVWDLSTANPIHTLTGHRGSVAALAASPDGALIASAGWDGRIGLWDVSEGALIGWLEGHDGAVNDVAFADDGRLLHSASADGTVRSWDVEERAERRVEVRHGFAVNVIALDEAAGWLAYGAVDGGTRVIALADASVLADLTLERRPILALDLAPSGDRLAVGDGEGHIMVIDTRDFTIAHDFQAAARGPIWALAYADGDTLAAGGIDDAARLFSATGSDQPMVATAPRSFHRAPETMANGERQFQRKCSVCHTLAGDGDRRAGPTLANIFGRPAGAIPGYRYSDALLTSDIVWSDETLDALFDAGPEHYVPGSHMPMQRITSGKDRRDLIEYLKTATKQGG